MNLDDMLAFFESLYIEANKEYQSDPEFEKDADAATLRLHRKDPAIMPIFRLIRAISVSGMMDIYEKLGVNMPLEAIRGESFYAGVPQVTHEYAGRVFMPVSPR